MLSFCIRLKVRRTNHILPVSSKDLGDGPSWPPDPPRLTESQRGSRELTITKVCTAISTPAEGMNHVIQYPYRENLNIDSCFVSNDSSTLPV